MPPRPPAKPLSMYQQHCQKWGKGCGHTACSIEGTKIVLARGKVPCQVLFTGEAPGESENTLGQPFMGQAGRLLDDIISRAITEHWPDVRVGICNLVGCLPRSEGGPKAGEPEDSQIRQCSGRLREFIELCQPKIIVRVGKHARQWLTPHMKDSIDIPESVVRIDMMHPAAILRMHANLKSIKIRESIITVSNAVEKVMSGQKELLDWGSPETMAQYGLDDIPF